ncbi:fungal cellulose binding domain-containing protein [Diaporthe helianthi]|uniref:lytic cellulose monooxygenase (C4-dehydrogenating) n=1 Tax=Diaporthe helianthi TaxID=158607 RepID=A0A2P5HSK5_DIAHE|nr:fungal cellulose binding domain-containing protein [Diaporthe helianthi]
MSKAPGNVSDYDGSGEWFKVHELGMSLNPDSKSKYDRVLWNSMNQDQFTFRLPTTTPPGQYLLRIESAQITASFNSTQRFVQCAQIDVEGPGGGNPQPTMKIPSPEMMFDRGQWVSSNLYFPERASDEDILSFKPPYGPVWTG